MKFKDVVAIGPDGSEYIRHINSSQLTNYMQTEARVAHELEKDQFMEVKKGMYTDAEFDFYRDHMKLTVLAGLGIVTYKATGMKPMPQGIKDLFEKVKAKYLGGGG
jgi:hypothetical protein